MPDVAAFSTNDSKNAQMSRLLRHATPKAMHFQDKHRVLDEDDVWLENGVVDLSRVSLKIDQCRHIQAYDDVLAVEDSDTVLALEQFVIFKLCPSDTCNDSCTYNYGEYAISLEDYLLFTVEYHLELHDQGCSDCRDQCGHRGEREVVVGPSNIDGGEKNRDEDAFRRGARNLGDWDDFPEDPHHVQGKGMDCNTCYDECAYIERMEENGYIPATEFLRCQIIYDPEDDEAPALYAGPMCASEGQKIKIAVFSDADCNTLEETKNVDDYLMDENGYNIKLSYAMLKRVWPSEECTECKNDRRRANSLEMCNQLYGNAAKCESPHGFSFGMTTAGANVYANQLAQEDQVCDFVESLKFGTYDERGEIRITGSDTLAGPLHRSDVTLWQLIGLAAVVVGVLGLARYAKFLHSKMVNIRNQYDISRSTTVRYELVPVMEKIPNELFLSLS